MQTVKYCKRESPIPVCLEEALPEKLLLCLRTFGIGKVEEIRLYRDNFVTLTVEEKNRVTDCFLSGEELDRSFRILCHGSPYAYRDPICQGYLSPGEGVRVGICGRALVEGGQVLGVTDLSGLVIRVPHALFVPAKELLSIWQGGLLIYAPPGVGKTTLLRSLALEISKTHRTVLLDPKSEFFGTIPRQEEARLLHLLTSFPQGRGIEIAVRNLGAECILTDEIGSEEEADSILFASNRGVPLIATAHAKNRRELFLRPALCRLLDSSVFERLVGLSRDGYGRFSYELSFTKEA